MNQWLGMFDGYKTYVTAFFGIGAAWAAHLTGVEIQGVPVMEMPALLQFTFTGLLAASVRRGIASSQRSSS